MLRADGKVSLGAIRYLSALFPAAEANSKTLTPAGNIQQILGMRLSSPAVIAAYAHLPGKDPHHRLIRPRQFKRVPGIFRFMRGIGRNRQAKGLTKKAQSAARLILHQRIAYLLFGS